MLDNHGNKQLSRLLMVTLIRLLSGYSPPFNLWLVLSPVTPPHHICLIVPPFLPLVISSTLSFWSSSSYLPHSAVLVLPSFYLPGCPPHFITHPLLILLHKLHNPLHHQLDTMLTGTRERIAECLTNIQGI